MTQLNVGVFIPSGNNDEYTGVNGGNGYDGTEDEGPTLPGEGSGNYPKYGINPWYPKKYRRVWISI